MSHMRINPQVIGSIQDVPSVAPVGIAIHVA